MAAAMMRRCGLGSSSGVCAAPHRRVARVAVTRGTTPRAAPTAHSQARESVPQQQQRAAFEVGKTLGLASVASAWLAAGNAQAAQEVSQLAASDNRFGLIAVLFVPVLAWAAYNILGPLLRQLDIMSERTASPGVKKAKRAIKKGRGVFSAVGIGAALSMLVAERADASNEVAQLAGDNRFGTILLLFVPVVGWVLYNAYGPAISQLNKMSGRADDSAVVVKKAKKILKKR